MSQSIKFDNDTFVDASAVRDTTRNLYQDDVNAFVFKPQLQNIFVGTGSSLRTMLQSQIGSNTFSVFLFNNPSDNLFVYGGTTITTGLLIVCYSASFWADHPTYYLFNNANIYFGTIALSTWTLDSITKMI